MHTIELSVGRSPVAIKPTKAPCLHTKNQRNKVRETLFTHPVAHICVGDHTQTTHWVSGSAIRCFLIHKLNTGIATAATSLHFPDVTFEVLYGKQKHTCQLSTSASVEIAFQTAPFMPHPALGTSRALAIRFEKKWDDLIMLRFSFFQRGRIGLNNLVSIMQPISLYG